MPDQTTLEDRLRTVRRSRPVQIGSSVGYVAVGVVHLIIAWIALRLAFGDGGGEGDEADQAGALREIASQPAGGVALWFTAAALLLLGFWQISGAIIGLPDEDPDNRLKERGRAAGKSVVHLALAVTTFGVVLGTGESGDEQAEEGAGILIGSTPGRVLLFAIGLGIIGFAGYQIFIGLTRRFLRVLRDDMHDRWEPVVQASGMVGYPARGVGLVIVGILVCTAAVSGDEEEAGGLDAALTTLAEQPYGPWALAVVALGFAAFGIFSFGRARYGRI
ncbi:DUF1206 domain-containing protein [Cellulomonas bogoriensis]|uniref:Membrane protein n=1 Tax=Cellulomonas bogoriensis 69B4 = DSM 16987 TaxID=1386082 RepID=A0A0A0C0J1_9CELL|nr:DUF1206 domain-containing protein [Cellulomonas bogoriensis]KGM13472.1 membrane protein [Cellulomonas bogoriensis 69B4 = DSM 16987]